MKQIRVIHKSIQCSFGLFVYTGYGVYTPFYRVQTEACRVNGMISERYQQVSVNTNVCRVHTFLFCGDL